MDRIIFNAAFPHLAWVHAVRMIREHRAQPLGQRPCSLRAALAWRRAVDGQQREHAAASRRHDAALHQVLVAVGDQLGQARERGRDVHCIVPARAHGTHHRWDIWDTQPTSIVDMRDTPLGVMDTCGVGYSGKENAYPIRSPPTG